MSLGILDITLKNNETKNMCKLHIYCIHNTELYYYYGMLHLEATVISIKAGETVIPRGEYPCN